MLAAFALPVFVSAQSIACTPLSKGTSGPRVIALQTFLHEAYIEFPAPTGYFGQITEAAVKQWQQEKGVVSSGSAATTGWGVVGPKTMRAMGLCPAGSSSSVSSSPLPSSSVANPSTVSSTSTTDPTNPALINAITAQIAALMKQITDLKAGTTATAPTTIASAQTNVTTNTTPATQTQIAPTSLARCTWNGTTIGSGVWVEAYQAAVVSSGSSCAHETRICSNGVLSGSYTAASCIVGVTSAAPLFCSFEGTSVPDGISVPAFLNPYVAYGGLCTSEWRTCKNGTLSGSYQYSTCTVTNPDPASSEPCYLNGSYISNGASTIAYQSASVQSGSTCVSESRMCTNGVLSGSYQNSTCSVGAAASCTFNGSTVSSGGSVTAYQTSSVAYGSTCTSQSRTCTNGVLSGSYQNSSCSVAAGASCVFNGQTIAQGGSVAAFQNTVVNSNASCASQTRTCTNGTLSGSSAYAYDHCTVSSNNASLPSTFVPITYNGKNIQLHAWFATPGGSGPYPAIVLAHGCSGLNPDDNGSDWAHENTWAQTFRASGYATLIVDSFTARGISSGICGNSDFVSPLDRAADLYSAATVLAKMSAINPQKIGIFGTSHGANAAAWSIKSGQFETQSALTALSAAGGKISASAGLYPNCDSAFSGNSFYSPFFVAIGSADTSANSSTCKSLTNFPTVSGTPADVNSFGSLVRIIVYPNVGHRFDVQNSGEYSASVTTDVQSKIKTFFDSYVR